MGTAVDGAVQLILAEPSWATAFTFVATPGTDPDAPAPDTTTAWAPIVPATIRSPSGIRHHWRGRPRAGPTNADTSPPFAVSKRLEDHLD
jgi:hypothetical protein